MVILSGLSLSDWASLATVIGVVGAFFAVIMLRSQIRISNSIRTSGIDSQNIQDLWGESFIEFYDRIRRKDKIDWRTTKLTRNS